MSKIFGKLGRLLTSARAKPVGRDLEGNRYFEIPSPNGGRTKRTVDYAIKRDLADYTDGQRLPVQWLSWLSHTRSTAPSLQELQADMERQTRLRQNVLEIEARDTAEANRRLLAQPNESAETQTPHSRGQEAQHTLDENATARLSHLSPRSPPVPQKGTSDPVGPSDSAHATTQSTSRDPTAASSPTLRELSQLRMERERAELERKGVSLAEAAGHEPDAPGAAMGVAPGTGGEQSKPAVQAAIPAARRRGASPAAPPPASPAQGIDESRLGPQSALAPAGGQAPHSASTPLAPEPAGAPSRSPSEFARAHAEMHKSPLEGFAPASTDAASAAQAGRVASDEIKDSTREPGTKNPGGVPGSGEPQVRPGQGPLYGEKRAQGQGPLYGEKRSVWDAAKASRARGE